MDEKGAQHDRRRHVAGDAERHHGDQRAALGGVVRRFGRHNAVDDAGSEFFRVLGSLFGLVVGQDVGNRAAGVFQSGFSSHSARPMARANPSKEAAWTIT